MRVQIICNIFNFQTRERESEREEGKGREGEWKKYCCRESSKKGLLS